MRDWLVTYYHGIPFVFGVVGVFQNKFRPSFPEGDFFLMSRCTIDELPFPLWLVGERTVWVTNPDQMRFEFQKILDVVKERADKDG